MHTFICEVVPDMRFCALLQPDVSQERKVRLGNMLSCVSQVVMGLPSAHTPGEEDIP